MSPQVVSDPRRRWWQFTFTLRTMLVLVTVLCVWLAIHTQRARRQQQIVERIREKSCSCIYDYHNKNNLFRSRSESWVPIWILDCVGEDFYHTVTSVVIFDELVDDAAMLPHLQELVIVDEGGLTDEKLAALRGHHGLRTLRVFRDYGEEADAGRITDRSLALLGELPALEDVRITTGQFSAKGLRDLAHGPRLVQVDIGCCDESVTPSAVELFRQHSCVRSLYLRGATEAEVVVDWTR